jgi:hypothetical protein
MRLSVAFVWGLAACAAAGRSAFAIFRGGLRGSR